MTERAESSSIPESDTETARAESAAPNGKAGKHRKKKGKSAKGKSGKPALKNDVHRADGDVAPPHGGPDPELARALAAFEVDAPELDPVIANRAYRSGDYPYSEPPGRKEYDQQLMGLQIELLKLQEWVKTTRERVVMVFEGRDAAGKGGAIHRVVQHLNPRFVRVVALGKPTEIETAQWYFQRYVAHLPYGGEMALFDRSWYNRAVVEPVMGFCTPQQTAQFLAQVPVFEKMLVDDGVRLFKIWLDIGREMQLKRLHARHRDPLKQWKLSPVDFAAPSRWDAISAARDAMIKASHTPAAPWTVVLANDKRRARLGVMRHLLAQIPYTGRDDRVVGVPDPAIVLNGHDFVEQAAPSVGGPAREAAPTAGRAGAS